jgi:Dipeptidyl aminopeptidases/acylaminoacyl-peptidases
MMNKRLGMILGIIAFLAALTSAVYVLTAARGYLFYKENIPFAALAAIGGALILTAAAGIYVFAKGKKRALKTAAVIVSGVILISSLFGIIYFETSLLFGASGVKSFSKYYRNIETADARRETIRSGILEKLDLKLDEGRAPPPVEITNRIEYGDYAIDAFELENGEGYVLRGNIYSPIDPVNAPAVLIPHGHFDGGRFNPDNQILAISFAKIGCVAVVYDMVGLGEDTDHKHEDRENNRIQTLNSIRLVDYLASLPYVDPSRIAATGASGGGTQTILLAALDDRVSVAVPVCMVSAYFQGGCLCENGYRVWEGKGYRTNNAELISLFAPKKLLLVSDGGDWTRGTPEIEFPFIQSVYALYGAPDNVQNAHFPAEGHDYGPSKRRAALQFIAECFDLTYTPFDETGFEILPKEALYNK